MSLRNWIVLVAALAAALVPGTAFAQNVQVTVDVPIRSGAPVGLPMTGAFIGSVFAIGLLALFAGLTLRRVMRRGRPGAHG